MKYFHWIYSKKPLYSTPFQSVLRTQPTIDLRLFNKIQSIHIGNHRSLIRLLHTGLCLCQPRHRLRRRVRQSWRLCWRTVFHIFSVSGCGQRKCCPTSNWKIIITKERRVKRREIIQYHVHSLWQLAMLNKMSVIVLVIYTLLPDDQVPNQTFR